MIRRISLHVVFWGVYLAINVYVEVFLINYSYFNLDMGTRILKALIPELLLLPAKLLMAYTFMYWILPQLNSIARWKNVFVLIVVTVVSLGWYHLMLSEVIYPVVNHEVFPESTFMQYISRSVYRLLDLLTIVGITCTFKLLRQQTKDAKKKQELMQEKLQSELNFIRAQTNPHFLFNTLNSIYALARKQSPQTPEVVMQLSKLLRYMIHECKEPFVPLENEWKIIEDYVSLEKLRYGNRVHVQMNKQIIPNGEMIAPLLLLPLVENAFKHGAGNNRDHTEILIHLDKKNDELHFTVENNVGDNRNENTEGGIGLKNVKRQLELLYPEHSFNVDQQRAKFTVTISFKSNRDAEVPDCGR